MICCDINNCLKNYFFLVIALFNLQTKFHNKKLYSSVQNVAFQVTTWWRVTVKKTKTQTLIHKVGNPQKLSDDVWFFSLKSDRLVRTLTEMHSFKILSHVQFFTSGVRAGFPHLWESYYFFSEQEWRRFGAEGKWSMCAY